MQMAALVWHEHGKINEQKWNFLPKSPLLLPLYKVFVEKTVISALQYNLSNYPIYSRSYPLPYGVNMIKKFEGSVQTWECRKHVF